MKKPKRTRIADIVRKTGLSRATVDRAINGRGSVSPAAEKRIISALNELQFTPSRLDSLLQAKPVKVHVFMMEGANPFFKELEKGVREAVDRNTVDNSVTFHSFDPYNSFTLAKKLSEVPPDTHSVVTVGIDSPDVITAINDLEARGVRVVVILSDVAMSQRSAYVGMDNFAAGRVAARLLIETSKQSSGTFASLVSHMQFRHFMDRRAGFEQFIAMEGAGFNTVLTDPFGPDPDTLKRILNDVLDTHSDVIGFYLCGGVYPDVFEAIASSDVTIIAHEVTPYIRQSLLNGTLNYIIAHDVYELGHKAMRAAWCKHAENQTTLPCAINVYMPENLPQSLHLA